MGKIALGFFLVLASPIALAQMYKCVDERGRIHYSDKPLPGCKPAAGSSQAAPPRAAKVAPSTAPKAVLGAQAQRKRAEPKRGPGERQLIAQEKAAAAARCPGLRQEYAWLSGPRGAAVEARAERLAQLQQALRACP